MSQNTFLNFYVIIVTIFYIANQSECQKLTQTSSSRKDHFRKDECTRKELSKCMHFLQSMAGNEDSALPSGREELNNICNDLRIGVKCLDRHSRQCFSPEQAIVFKDLLDPAREFISQLCEEGSIQSGYLKHASCFRNISMDVEKCAVKYKVAVNTSASASEIQNMDLSMRLSCCSFKEFLNCKYQFVGKDCGSEAEMFMKNHLDKITNPVMDRHCSAYTFGPESCSTLLPRHDQHSTDFSNNFTANILIIQFMFLSYVAIVRLI